MTYFWLGLILVLVLGIAVVVDTFWVRRSRKRQVEAAFAGRQRLTAEESSTQEFTDEEVLPDVIERVRKVLESELEADLTRLRSTDDFSKNLSFFADYDSLATVNILYALEEEFGISIEDEEAEKMVTFRDIVLTVSEKLKSKS